MTARDSIDRYSFIMNKKQAVCCVVTLLFASWLGWVVSPPAAIAVEAALDQTVYIPIANRALPAFLNAFEAEVIDLVNEERLKVGCPGLNANPHLRQAAFLHSQDMGDNGFFSHTGSNGSNFVQRAQQAGYGGSPRGENIAAGYGSPAAVMSGWMNSTGHRNNILNCNSSEIGVGYYYTDQGYGHYWTQVIGRE